MATETHLTVHHRQRRGLISGVTAFVLAVGLAACGVSTESDEPEASDSATPTPTPTEETTNDAAALSIVEQLENLEGKPLKVMDSQEMRDTFEDVNELVESNQYDPQECSTLGELNSLEVPRDAGIAGGNTQDGGELFVAMVYLNNDHDKTIGHIDKLSKAADACPTMTIKNHQGTVTETVVKRDVEGVGDAAIAIQLTQTEGGGDASNVAFVETAEGDSDTAVRFQAARGSRLITLSVTDEELSDELLTKLSTVANTAFDAEADATERTSSPSSSAAPSDDATNAPSPEPTDPPTARKKDMYGETVPPDEEKLDKQAAEILGQLNPPDGKLQIKGSPILHDMAEIGRKDAERGTTDPKECAPLAYLDRHDPADGMAQGISAQYEYKVTVSVYKDPAEIKKIIGQRRELLPKCKVLTIEDEYENTSKNRMEPIPIGEIGEDRYALREMDKDGNTRDPIYTAIQGNRVVTVEYTGYKDPGDAPEKLLKEALDAK